MKKMTLVAVGVVCVLGGAIGVDAVEFVPTTVNGTVPGTAITFTITANGTAREIWSAGSSDGGLFSWTNGFPEFLATGASSLTVTFSEAIPVNRLGLGVNSISLGTFTLVVSGGTATTADFNESDGLTAVGGQGQATYNPATGEFTQSTNDESLIIGGGSANTLTSFTISGDGGLDGYTLFFGPTTDPLPVELQSFTAQ